MREAEEKKRRACAEAATRRSEQLLRALIEQFTDCAIYVLDPQGRVASWNAGAERLTGPRAFLPRALPACAASKRLVCYESLAVAVRDLAMKALRDADRPPVLAQQRFAADRAAFVCLA